MDKHTPLQQLPTYRIGLIQVHAYRKLYARFSALLKEHGLTHTEWTLLGILSQHGDMSLQQLATLLDVEPPFTTRLAHNLEKQKFIARKTVATDKRIRLMCLTDTGRGRMQAIERQLRQSLNEYLSSIKKEDLITYLRVLHKIAELPG